MVRAIMQSLEPVTPQHVGLPYTAQRTRDRAFTCDMGYKIVSAFVNVYIKLMCRKETLRA
jgi:hypothetical protein